MRLSKPSPIVVNLPDIESVPLTYRGMPYTIRGGLLGDGESNPKLTKSDAASSVYRSWGLSLAPSKASGYQVCSSASEGCVKSCLHFQGHARIFSSIHAGRIAKTIAFFEEREWFVDMLRYQLSGITRQCEQKGYTPAVRLNVVSDIQWESVFPWMFTEFSGVQFYDYTKHILRMLNWANGLLPKNYHLTFSRSEANDDSCLRVLKARGNVAVVFRQKSLPKKWRGTRVICGDKTDLRFLDPKGCVVGLYAKGTASKDASGFVVSNRRIALTTI